MSRNRYHGYTERCKHRDLASLEERRDTDKMDEIGSHSDYRGITVASEVPAVPQGHRGGQRRYLEPERVLEILEVPEIPRTAVALAIWYAQLQRITIYMYMYMYKLVALRNVSSDWH